jgi:TolB protein
MRKLTFLLILIFVFACKDDSYNKGCPHYEMFVESPYNDPVWHPSGNIIGFNHIPIKEINYINGYECPNQAQYFFEEDSAGFWLINADGTNQRRILPYMLNNPSWSPDGNWIAFSSGAQICIMPFDGEQFDTAAIVQLTFEGRNFFPAWSPDGEWIAFDESVCNGPIACGIWIFNISSKQQQFIKIYGMYPSWHPFSDNLIFLTNALDNKGFDVGDSLWIYDSFSGTKHFFKFISQPNYDNRYLRYSPNGEFIAFVSILSNGSGMQLFTIKDDGSGLKQLSTEGCMNFSWSPQGEIVYSNYDYHRIDETRGTLWIMDADGNNKRQLTRNIFKQTQ